MVNATQSSTDAAALFASMNASANSATSATSVAAATQDRFLKLLVTQMKNQDPLNPMDNAQVTSQMAQLSTVSGIDKMNTTLQALNASMTANQTVQATGMIGHGVLVAGDGVDLASGTPGLGGFELTQPVDSAEVSIYDNVGALVKTIDLGAQAAGVNRWQWDGTNNAGANVAAGSYTFTVNARQAGSSVPATGLQFGLVNSVTQSAQGVALSVGSLDGIALSQIKQIL